MDISKVELRHLRYFVAVAEELHFGRAAARLGLAQPPLSQQIQRLEHLLDARLFTRSRRRVELTEAGHVLLDEARGVLAAVERGLGEVHRAARGESGSLTVSFAASVMFLALPRIIRDFRERYPDVQLELRELPTAPQLDAIASGEIDLGFVREPPATAGLAFATVSAEPLHIAVGATHPLARRTRVPLRLLADQDFVLFPADVAPGLHAQVIRLCRDAGFTPRVVQVSRELYTTVSLVEAGVGVTIVPASIEKMGWTGVSYKPIPGPLGRTRIAMAWREGSEATRPVLKSFMEVVRKHRG